MMTRIISILLLCILLAIFTPHAMRCRALGTSPFACRNSKERLYCILMWGAAAFIWIFGVMPHVMSILLSVD